MTTKTKCRINKMTHDFNLHQAVLKSKALLDI